MKMYEVGGCVRDEILGVKSKDIDFSVVLDEPDLKYIEQSPSMLKDPYVFMVDQLKSYGYTIYVEHPEHLTARGKFPVDHGVYPGLDADFVLARREGEYSDGRRPDEVFPGTLEDDLARRDFTMNAIAKDILGNYIDPHNGRGDIDLRLIRAVGDPFARLNEDALRAVRAVRFSVTKNMQIDTKLAAAIQSIPVLQSLYSNIAAERISDELSKMFRYDSKLSILTLYRYPSLMSAIFDGHNKRISLDSTLKTKGRGK